MGERAHIRITESRRGDYARIERRSVGGAFSSTIVPTAWALAEARRQAEYEPARVWDARMLPAVEIAIYDY